MSEHVVDGRWLSLGRDGRLTAFVRTTGGLLRWTEQEPGGPKWTGPDFIETPELTHVTVVQGADGYLHFLGRRTARGAGGAPVVDYVRATQFQTGRPMTDWMPLGNPSKDPERAARAGAPVGAVSASGAVHLFVRHAGGGVSMRREGRRGGWGAWQNLKGQHAVDGAAAVVGSSGLVELLVPASNGRAMHWGQSVADGEVERRPNLRIAPVAGSLAALETVSGRVTYYWTDAASGQILAHRVGDWVIALGGAPAEGRLAALRAALDGYDCTVLAHWGFDGQVMLAACATENEGAGVWWSPTGEQTACPPALALDGYGRVVIGTVDAGGALRIARQRPEPGLSMDPAIQV
ncbi:hypothetical protein ABZZ20_06510 [Streptomyces sp. NPDC006430]|uniref:hypothetical protein n=1 Tax=Streptomyces sp. NPDC006430 TaxID=3154299 RepID=UPI0033BD5467